MHIPNKIVFNQMTTNEPKMRGISELFALELMGTWRQLGTGIRGAQQQMFALGPLTG